MGMLLVWSLQSWNKPGYNARSAAPGFRKTSGRL